VTVVKNENIFTLADVSPHFPLSLKDSHRQQQGDCKEL
jgi:hypothetical protein